MEATKFIWMDGEMVPWEQATVHVLAHGLHYGTGVFEGIRAYETDRGTAIFRLTDHMERLLASAKAYRIPVSWSADELAKAARELLTVNELAAGYIRPIVFYGVGSLGLNPAGAEVKTAIGCFPWGAYLGEEGLRNGIRVAVSSWSRIDHRMLVPNAKGAGGYLNSILAKQEALAGGYDEAIMLNIDGFVSEGSGENVFVVRRGRVTTPPHTVGALDGITRNTVVELLSDDGVSVEMVPLTRSDLYYGDEIFFTGTAAEVTPIREVDNRPVGTGKPGPVTRRVQELYMDAVHGRLDAHQHWLEYV